MPAATVGTDTLAARFTREACVAFTHTTLHTAAVVVACVRAFSHGTIQPSMAAITEASSIWLAGAESRAIVHAGPGRACSTGISLSFEKCLGLFHRVTFTSIRGSVASTTVLRPRAVEWAKFLATGVPTVAFLAAAHSAQTPPMQRAIVQTTTILTRGPPEVWLTVAYSFASAFAVATAIERAGLLITCAACPHLTVIRSDFLANRVTLA